MRRTLSIVHPTSDRFDAGLTANQRPIEIKRNKLDRHAEVSYQVELKLEIVRIAEGDELGLLGQG